MSTFAAPSAWSAWRNPKALIWVFFTGAVTLSSSNALSKKSGRAGNRTWTSESVARNSDHQTTEVVTGKALDRRKEKEEWISVNDLEEYNSNVNCMAQFRPIEELEFDTQQGQENCILSTASTWALVHT
jgi:hypothetical protein